MKKFKKAIVSIIVLAIIIVGYGFYRKNNNADLVGVKKETIKIGVILPLTGPLASLGEGAKNGAELAYKNFSTQNKQNISLLFEDDYFDPKTTISAFNKLVGIDQVSAVICFTSNPCASIAPIAENKSIPLIAIASAPVQLNRQNVFRLEISTQFEAEKLLAYLKSKNYTRLASIIALQDGVQSVYKIMKSEKLFNGKEVISETVVPDAKDYRTITMKLLVKKPDVILVGLLSGVAGDFAKQARELGYKGDFVAFNFIEGEETLAAAGNNFDGVVYTQAADAQNWFAKNYQNEYKKAMTPGSAHAYDAITLIGSAIKQKSGNAKQDIKEFFNNVVVYHGALGIFSSTDGHEFTIPLILKTIRDGKFVPLEN